jgi:hypothetical protein
MEEQKVLFILENFYGALTGKLKYPVYSMRLINKKNATYSRILPAFKDTPFRIYFSETTPFVAKNKDDKFDVDLEWIKQALAYREWFAVIACCKKAELALKEIGYEPFMNLPHPASWAWRKTMIVDCVDKLNLKLETMK